MDSQLQVWIVDDDQSVRWVLEKALHQAAMQTRSFERAEHLLEALDENQPDVLITDVRMPGMDGLTLLSRLSERCPELPVIVVTAHSDLDNAVAAYQGGAFEYLPKPFDVDEAVRLVEKAARQGGHAIGGATQPKRRYSIVNWTGACDAGGVPLNRAACTFKHDRPDYRRIRNG